LTDSYQQEGRMFGFDEKKKKIFTICSIIYAILILLVVVITNFDRFAGFNNWINDKLAVLTPIVVGGVIAYMCTFLVRFFQNRVYKNVAKKRLRRTLSIVSAYIGIIAVVVVFIALVLPQLLSSIEDLVKKISDGTYLNEMLNAINKFINRFISNRNEEVFEFISMDKITEMLSAFFAGTENILMQIISFIRLYGGSILNAVKNGVIGFLLSIYFVISKDRLYAQSTRIMSAFLSKKKSESLLGWVRFADKTFGGFIVGKLIDALFVIIVCSIVFSVAKIPYAMLISVVIGVCNIIPFFGPFIGAVPSGFIVFIAQPEKLIMFVILLLVVQQIDANIIEPKIVGDRTGLSSLGVLVAVTVMSGYFGILGMFLGVPIFAVICAIIRVNIEKKLAAKNLPVEVEEYYSKNSLVEPRENVEHLSAKVFRLGGSWIKREERILANKFKRLRGKKSRREDDEAFPTEPDTDVLPKDENTDK